MFVFLVRRIVSMIPVLFIVAVVVFTLTRLTPGDPAILMLGEDTSPERVAQMRQQLGLDQPLFVQFFAWIGQLLQGNFGQSLWYGRPVLEILAQHFEVTVLLTLVGFALAVFIGVPAGVLAATNHRSWLGQIVMVLATIGMAFPEFWMGLNLVILFSITWPILPSSGYVSPFVSFPEGLVFLILPAIAVSLKQAAYLARMTRSSMLDVLSADYIRSARAKGLGDRVVIWGHAFRNVGLAVLTVTGLVLGTMVSGAIVVETVFALPGLGSLIVSSIAHRDYAIIQAAVIFVAFAYSLVNLFTDMLYVAADPRVNYD